MPSGQSFDIESGGTLGVESGGTLALEAGSALSMAGAITGTLDLNGNFDQDGTTCDILVSGAFSIDGGAASNVSATAGNLTVSTLSSGSLILDGVALVDINAGANLDIDVTGTFDMLSSGAFSVDGTGASNVSSTSGNLTISTLTTGALILDSVALLDMNAGAGLDIDVTGIVAIDSTGTVSIDGVGNSNVTIDSGNLVIETTTSGTLDINAAAVMDVDAAGVIQLTSADSSAAAIYLECSNAAGGIDIDAGTTGIALDSTGAISLDGVGNSNFTTDTGNLTLSTSTSGNVVIDAIGTVDIGGTATAIALDSLVELGSSAGDSPANALLMGVGTSGDPATTAVAGKDMVEIRAQSTATSGDFRNIYLRTDFAGAGGAGESIRANTVINADVAGTVNGIHASAEVKTGGGNVSGQAHGVRGGFIVPNDGSINKGTVAGICSEIYLSGTSSVLGAAQHSIHRFVVAGADAATRAAQVKNLYSVEGVASGSGDLYYANTAATGNHTASLRILTDDGVKYLYLWDAEA